MLEFEIFDIHDILKFEIVVIIIAILSLIFDIHDILKFEIVVIIIAILSLIFDIWPSPNKH